MLRISFACYALFLFVSCAPPPTTEAVRAYNRERLGYLSVGMPKSEVLRVMGNKTFVTFEGWVVNNPYRTEVRQDDNGTVMEVLYYYTDVRSRDDAVSEDELTPIILVNDKVIGWGWTFFNDKVQKQQIQLR